MILDVVFNHTAEGGAGGPTLHFKALADDIFYHMNRATGAATGTTPAAATRSTATTRW